MSPPLLCVSVGTLKLNIDRIVYVTELLVGDCEAGHMNDILTKGACRVTTSIGHIKISVQIFKCGGFRSVKIACSCACGLARGRGNPQVSDEAVREVDCMT